MVGAGGLSILCALPDDEVQRICQENLPRVKSAYFGYTEKEIAARIKAGRETGYVFANVLERPGIRALGMCVRNKSGYPVAALSLSAFVERWTDARKQWVVELLREIVRELEDVLSRETVPTIRVTS